MDFDREYELENAGIDAFDYSLMADDERAAVLRDAGLDPDDFDGVEFESSYDAWLALQAHGLNLWELELMDDDEKRETLEAAGLDPDDYESFPSILTSSTYTAPGTTYQSTSSHAPAANNYAETGMDRASPDNGPSIYQFCSVVFPGSYRGYAYRVVGTTVKVGDFVIVPTGLENTPKVAKVISTGVYTEEAAPYPVEKAKFVLRLATEAESAPFIPTPVNVEEAPVYTPPVQAQPVRKSGNGAGWFAAAAVILLVLVIAASQPSKPSSVKSSSGSYSSYRSSGRSSSTGSYSATPSRPPVNRELAMTREEAERLSGTGYHGTRPNSSAENTELKAAQVRCKNCGYRSHNGLNSLCDYCSWMERYGGGLPTYKAPDVTPKPTPRPTPKPTPRPTAKPQTSDPYHADDYAHPEDFYFDYYDDFWDYEDAEDYWEAYN